MQPIIGSPLTIFFNPAEKKLFRELFTLSKLLFYITRYCLIMLLADLRIIYENNIRKRARKASLGI